MKLHRLRKIILITGTTLCVLIAAAFVVSAWWWLWVAVPGETVIYVQAGMLECHWAGEVRTTVWAAGYTPHGEGLRFALFADLCASGFAVALIYPFLAIAIPTLLVWRFGRERVKPGHCRCGYDLTGNTSGVCPECGQPFEREGDAP